MDEFELHPVWVGKEYRIVVGAVLWVFRRGIEDSDPFTEEELIQLVHILPIFGSQGQVM